MSKRLEIIEALISIRKYCTFRDRSHKEVMTKLKSMGVWTIDAQQLISQMIEEGFLNEERFARSYVRGHFYQKKWGKAKIRAGLASHKIHSNLIDLAMAEIQTGDYIQTIRNLIDQKYGGLHGSKLEIKRKINNFMLLRGYAYSDYKEAIESVLDARSERTSE